MNEIYCGDCTVGWKANQSRTSIEYKVSAKKEKFPSVNIGAGGGKQARKPHERENRSANQTFGFEMKNLRALLH
jgi:hypothetical protein